MGNGGWYGTQEQWEEVERPLPSLDPIFEQFAEDNGFKLSRNAKDWPERSLRKDMPFSSMVQVFRADLNKDAWQVWAVCHQDRGAERYWKQQMIAEGLTGEELTSSLKDLLDQCLRYLVAWNAHPEALSFATSTGSAT